MTQTPAEQVGTNVRAEMARAGLSQTALAEHLGMSQTGVSKRLRGMTPFDVNELTRVAEILGLEVMVLLSPNATTSAQS